MRLYDKNLYLCCDNNPVVRYDVGGMLWQAVLFGAAVNVVTTWIAAKITGQRCSIEDYVMAAVTGGIAAIGVGEALIAGLISGAYAFKTAAKNGAGFWGAFFSGVSFSVGTGGLGGIGALDEAGDFVGAVFGASGNFLSWGVGAGVSERSKNSTKPTTKQYEIPKTPPLANCNDYRFLWYEYRYNGKTGLRTIRAKYMWNKTGRVFYVTIC